MSVRCLLVDDNAAFLDAAGTLLERQGLTVVGRATRTDDAREQARELRPDVVVVDIVLGRESGLELARELGSGADGPTVILVSTHAEADFADLIQSTAAAGFLPKSELSAEAILRLLN